MGEETGRTGVREASREQQIAIVNYWWHVRRDKSRNKSLNIFRKEFLFREIAQSKTFK